MKKALLIGFVMFAAQASQAVFRGPDAMVDILRCQPLVSRPDMGMSVVVSQGGIAGITQVRVKRFFLGHSTTENYIVKQIASTRSDVPTIYRGRDVVLSVDFGSESLPNGNSRGFIQIKADNRMLSTESLSCGTIYHSM